MGYRSLVVTLPGGKVCDELLAAAAAAPCYIRRMSRPRSQLVLLTCALAFLLAQLSGAHYHRHIGHVLHAEADITDLHFWDTGVQNGDAGAHGHYQEPAGHAVHSFIDLKIDATGDGLLKDFKSTLLAGLLLSDVPNAAFVTSLKGNIS